MALIDQLSPASYKGAQFLVNRTSTSGGRKDAKHEFPNSNIQTIEDLGLSPRIYRITAIIAEPDYIQKRDTLLRALEEGGKGVLIHPFFGRIENIVARTFTMNEEVTRLGDTEINITFEPSDTDGLPTKTLNTVSLVSQQKTVVNNGVVSDITDRFKVTNTFAGNFAAAADKLNSIADTVTANVKSLTATPDQINDFGSLVNTFQSSINQLIGTPADLAAALDEIFTAIPPLYATATEQTAALSLFFEFGDDDPVINETTAGLIERKQNSDVLNNSVKAFSLAEAYTSSSQIAFTTVDDVENIADTLETAFQSIKSASGLS